MRCDDDDVYQRERIEKKKNAHKQTIRMMEMELNHKAAIRWNGRSVVALQALVKPVITFMK